MTDEQKALLADIIRELNTFSELVDPYLESDEVITLHSQLGRLELLLKDA